MRRILTFLFLLGAVCSFAQRQMEDLGRGLVAMKTSNGVYLSWRITAPEWYGTAYNVYRDNQKINDTPITGASNFTDAAGTATSKYHIVAVKNGEEGSPSPQTAVLSSNYLSIPLCKLPVSGYTADDATAADLDGDGEMEIILKRLYPDWTPQAQYFSYIEAYKLDGTHLWSINVGPNIFSDVETNVAAYDLDGDGKAEVFMRTSEGTVFADGTTIGDTDGDGITNYRSFSWGGNDGNYPNYSTYLCNGPEFLSLIDGETGKEMDRVDYIPRGNTGDWGDTYGHRANKFFFGAPYLDGKRPSLFISRGIYTRIVMRTYDVVDKKLKLRWDFDTNGNPAFASQGNHNMTIADIDGDGCDEIVYGSMTVDHTGKGLYSTGLGHGDAIHVSDLDPYHKGREVFACHEHAPFGTSFRDGKTGKILIRHPTSKDCGRCMAANVTDLWPGVELWGGGKMFSATTRQATEGVTSGGTENFRIFWDGDLLEETFNYHDLNEATAGRGEGAVYKYGKGLIFQTSGCGTNNYTKGNPCLQADILGDWREEIVMRAQDGNSIRIYTTNMPTEHRIYTLLHDAQYRQAVCWQMCGYNQPPHVSFFLGQKEGIVLPPPPLSTLHKLVHDGSAAWTASSFTRDGQPATYADGADVLLDKNGVLTLSGTYSPEILTVANLDSTEQGNYTLTGGALSGAMRLDKLGAGLLSLECALQYTGLTHLWEGRTQLKKEMQQSPILVDRFAELDLYAKPAKGVILEYGAILRIAGAQEEGEQTIGDSLYLKNGAELHFDFVETASEGNTPQLGYDRLHIDGDLVAENGVVLVIQPSGTMPVGSYTLVSFSGNLKGDLSNFVVNGIDDIPHRLEMQDGKIVLTISDTRMPGTVQWDGAENNGLWDLYETANFTLDGHAERFITGDAVVMNDEASATAVELVGKLHPSALTFDHTKAYTLSGSGSLEGNFDLIKKGDGTLTLQNTAGTFTGKIEILGGTVAVASLANSIQSAGSLGGVRTSAADFLMDGGTLTGTGSALTTTSPITVGENGATFNTSKGNITLEGPLSGGGVLVKSGGGTLHISTSNALSHTVVNAGTLNLATDAAEAGGVGSKIILNGGVVVCPNYTGMDSWGTVNWALEVPEGKTGTLNLDGRCNYNNVLTGEGTLNLWTPFVRSVLQGNWSGFAGTLHVTTDGDGGDLYIDNNHGGFPNANVVLADKVAVYNKKNTAVAFGSLTGTGSLVGDHEWIFGDKKSSYEYEGNITAGRLTKTGTSTLILSKGTNTYGGGTTIQGGTLSLTNTGGSATGSGIVKVQDGAVLELNRMEATSMGQINVTRGGMLRAIKSTTNGAIAVADGGALEIGTEFLTVSSLAAKSISLRKGAVLGLDLRGKRSYDKITLEQDLACAEGAIIKFTVSDNFSCTEDDVYQIVSTKISGNPTYDLPSIYGYHWVTDSLAINGKLCLKKWPTGIDAPEWSSKVSLEPLPAKDRLNVVFPQPVAGRISIFSSQGVMAAGVDVDSVLETTLETASLAPGYYMLLIETKDGERSIHRFVKE